MAHVPGYPLVGGVTKGCGGGWWEVGMRMDESKGQSEGHHVKKLSNSNF